MASYTDNSHQSSEIKSAINKFFNCRNKIIVSTPLGATVTATCNNTTLVSREYSGIHNIYYNQFGTWNITVSLGQYTIVETIVIDELKDYMVEVEDMIDPTLDNNSWNVIQVVARQSIGSSYWAIGSMKKIILNGTISYNNQSVQFSNDTYWVYILDFNKDYNQDANMDKHYGITFQCFRKETPQYGISDVVLYHSGSLFCVDVISSNTLVEWSESTNRRYICGTDINNTGTTFLSVIPDELRNVLLQVIKTNYKTYNGPEQYEIGTSTLDYIFLLSLDEVNNSSVLAIYNYYQNTTSNLNRMKKNGYDPSNPSSEVNSSWWTRTPIIVNDITQFHYINNQGSPAINVKSMNGYCFSPAFVVG